MHTHTHTYIYIYIYVCVYVYIYIYMYVCMYIYIYIYIYMYVCMYIYIYIYIYIYKHTQGFYAGTSLCISLSIYICNKYICMIMCMYAVVVFAGCLPCWQHASVSQR